MWYVAHEFYSVLKCFNSAKYRHVANNCTNEISCFKYAASQNLLNCQCSVVNWVDTSIKLKKSLDENHSIIDMNCLCCRMVKLVENKTKQL